ncbi:isoquinoline 1-oxidoreductase, beta subunit [Enhydrobacter aerosaccus]|uniref:Isoquinoline 1-oxidoreductase, beta subunit n=1 Tax=Enhydrobacter aerosaccus TaxID=225324 RepID=A0A1T4TI19_9HYPH|nr:molybdopterin cofactor-binding domain-containing protein [Enhydrobacter aerosaccus]SKA39901.1 isoquinoline 1-oxidoreductase, beta subunit [Enhydrobacter aerosaccus]
MSNVTKLGRRSLLVGSVGLSGLMLGVTIRGRRLFPEAYAAPPGPADLKPNLYVSIERSGHVTIVAHRSEMGTGIRTALPMVLADELEADWQRVSVVQAPGDAKYGDQNTDGSRSTRQFYQPMRLAGATARQMLESAAATEWGVAANECKAENHQVVHIPSGRRVDFGALVDTAAKLPVPPESALRLKQPQERRYIGTGVPIVDLHDILMGKAQYGIDTVVPGMKHASIERCPVYGGRALSFDAGAAMSVPGVEQVLQIAPSPISSGFLPLGGIAVIARNSWAAQQGRQRLKVEWDFGPNASYDSASYRNALRDTARSPGHAVRSEGDAPAALAASSHRIEAEYYVPHLAHAPMEPLAAVARVADGKCEVWTATQNPQAARTTVAQVLKLDEQAVTINVTLLGGGFGRKSKPDYVAEAAILAQRTGAPVKVTWTREDELQHSYYHAVCAQRLEAALDDRGHPVAWLHRTVFPSIQSTFQTGVTFGSAGELQQGVTDMPYAIPNIRCENGPAAAHVRIGWYRSVYNIPHAFAVGSFADELAHAARRDPLEYLHELIGPDRVIDLKASGVDYPNYGASTELYPIDTKRLRGVLELVGHQSGWGKPLPPRHGRGVAVHRSFLTYVAVIAEVAVGADGQVSVPRVDMAVDCGLCVHPERARAQFEGAAVMGLGNTLYSAITFRNGRSEQSNFTDYTVARIDAAPEVHVHLVPSEAPPGGVGEPGVPPVSAAICNAIFAATGKRIRALPVDPASLRASG